jgi:hypothetical protein
MNLVQVESALKLWVAALTGVAIGFVVFEGAPQPRTNGRLVTLSWVSMPTVGTDEVRYANDGSVLPPDANLTPMVVSLSKCTLQVTFDVNDNRPEAPHAFGLARLMLNRVRRPSSLAALRAVNLGFVGTTGPTNADSDTDDHNVSRAVLEVMMNASNLDRDESNPIGSVESIDLTSNTVDDEGGTPLPASLQMDHEVFGPVP